MPDPMTAEQLAAETQTERPDIATLAEAAIRRDWPNSTHRWAADDTTPHGWAHTSLAVAARIAKEAADRAVERLSAPEGTSGPHDVSETAGTRSGEPLATAQDVAAYLNLAVITLTKWRQRGKGPKWIKTGAFVRYRWADVDAWVEAGGDR